MGNPRIHVICGMCGSQGEISYEVIGSAEAVRVLLRCANCASLTEIGEVLPAKDEYELSIARRDHGIIS